MARFRDRTDAAEALARQLAELPLAPPVVVLALPRGGVPIGVVIARRLGAPLDLQMVRKIGAPWQPELAVAAVADAGGDEPVLVVDEDLAASTGADGAYIERCKAEQWREIGRRRAIYLHGRPPQPLAGATAIVVDDGLATGTTARAALQAVRRRGAAHVVLAVPVASAESVARLRPMVDRMVVLAAPPDFRAIGDHYADFHQVGDDEVVDALREVPASRPGRA